MSFDSVLIANRGEIARRIARTCRAMGLGVVAVYTDADAGAPHVAAADRAVRVPSYLDAGAIIAAARDAGAGAVHPGYGFLAENAGFARACAEAGLAFIGPSEQAIALMGDKATAKAVAVAAGVPVLPGYDGADQGALAAEAARIGAPVMVKAVMGGGGKGMRLVSDLADLPQALARARSEAERSFGDGRLMLERAVLAPRHVEVQVFGDTQGNVVHLFERDCSVQRRHQKVIEEAPSPAVDDTIRQRLCTAAVGLARACGYVGAGTVEFLLEGQEFWFLEMNTRLQVEHPVTEAVTGVDLVEWQIRVALGQALPLAQDQIALRGHAIEARLCAEDPARGFLPGGGRVLAWRPDPALRCDHALAVGTEVGAGFDPMLAKLIAWGPDRDAARAALVRGLHGTVLQGVASNQRFLAAVVGHDGIVAGPDTGFLDGPFAGDASLSPPVPDPALMALALLVRAGPGARGFSTVPAPALRRRFAHGDAVHDIRVRMDRDGAVLEDGTVVRIVAWAEGAVLAEMGGVTRRVAVAHDGGTVWLDDLALRDATFDPPARRAGAADGLLRAPMAGTVVQVAVAPGDRATAGQVVAVLEAMKMEHPLRAPFDGVVRGVAVAAGAQVAARALVAEITGESE